MWLSFPYAYSMRFAFDFSFRPTFHIVLLYLLFPCSCSAYQTSYSTSPGSSTGYVYTMALEHSLLVYRMAVVHSLLVYRMAVEHSLLRRHRSGTSVAWRQCELTCGYPFPMHIQCVSHSIFNSGQHFTLSFSTYSSHAAVVPTRLLIEHPPAPALGTYTRWRWSILFWYTGWRWSILRRRRSGTSVVWRQCELTCGYPFPMHIQCVSHSIFHSGQHFTLSFCTYSSHAAVVPTRLLIAHPPAPALGTYTRWRWSILFWYTGWQWSILYWYTGWR